MATEQDNLGALARGADAWDARDRAGWLYRFEDGLVVYARLFSDSRQARDEFAELTGGVPPVVERY
jgi:hypothetical protein